MAGQPSQPEDRLRRARGDGGLHWDVKRQRWIATATIGYDGRGKRVVKKAAGRTRTAAKEKLRAIMRDVHDGVSLLGPDGYTVDEALTDWLRFGITNRSDKTVELYRYLVEVHIRPTLGGRKLRELTAGEVEAWMESLRRALSTRTLQLARSCLNRSVARAVRRDLVRRNVVEFTEVPAGRAGRKSKAFTAEIADSVLSDTVSDGLYAFIVVSLLTGARTEELRALRWDHVHLDAVPAYLEVWRSVRAGGDTKTRKSRRTLALPARCVAALRLQGERQVGDRVSAGVGWTESGLVFTTLVGTAMDGANLRRYFRRALALVPGMEPDDWTPRELRHSFVSLMSDAGVPIEEISRLVGHSGTTVTELVYRHQLRPVIQTGAIVMDRLFASENVSHSVSHSVGPGDGETG